MKQTAESKVADEQAIDKYAKDIMELARDTITAKFRFFDAALANLKLEARHGCGGFATDGARMIYDPKVLLITYLNEPNIAVHAYLHALLHCVFFHQFQYDKMNTKYWDFATDIAVENIILEMNISSAALTRDEEAKDRIRKLKKWTPNITAEKLYRDFLTNGISMDAEKEYARLFAVDIHDSWHAVKKETDEIIITEEQWKKITERIKTELKTFSKDKSGSESLNNNLDEATKERYNYYDILRRFAVSGEEMTLSEDEFDYVYYMYGLQTYGNVPLIEPLEYKEVNKVKEFVIAIDTSASCRGSIVKGFLRKTYDILKGTENFFHTTNIHIVQCDAQIQSDTKITKESDFDDFIKNGKLNGFGATDFRPVFAYVDELRDKGEFENLKGLIYFTDGYGIYPERMPEYDVIFAFLDDDDMRSEVPVWAMKVILNEAELDEGLG